MSYQDANALPCSRSASFGSLSSSSTTGSSSRHYWTITTRTYRFEFNTSAERNNALKILERNGFDYDLVENLRGYVVKLPKFAKYAQILKNSVATKETATERIFLMKDLATVEEAMGLGAKRWKVK